MINTGSFLFNVLFDPTVNNAELTTEDLGNSQNILDDKEAPAADSFILLLAHFFPEPIIEPSLNATILDQDTAVSIQSTSSTDTVELSDTKFNADLITPAFPTFTDNIALNWINSASYEPPVVNQVFTLQRNSDNPVAGVNLNPEEHNLTSVLPENTIKYSSSDSSNHIPQSVLESNMQENNSPITFSEEEMMALSAPKEMEREVVINHKSDVVVGQLAFTTEQNKELLSNKELASNDTRLTDDVRTDVNTLNSSITQNTSGIMNKTPLPMFDIQQPLNSEQWADKFSEHIVWLSQQGIKSAVIKITPEDLGPLEINIKVIKDSTSLDIVSHSAQAKDSLEQALPRLRDMMAAQGLDLAEVSIEAETNSQRFSQKHQERESSASDLIDQAPKELDVTPLTRRSPKGLIDYFA